MATLRLIGTITEDGHINVELPKDVYFAAGEEIEVTVEMPEPTWTEDEFRELVDLMMNPKPKTGAEIVAFLESQEPGFLHITDSAAWVEEMRHGWRRNKS